MTGGVGAILGGYAREPPTPSEVNWYFTKIFKNILKGPLE